MRTRGVVGLVGVCAVSVALGVTVFAQDHDHGADDEDDAAQARIAEDAARELGKSVWADKSLGTNERTCSTCHENPKRPDLDLKGVTARWPRFDEHADRVITIQEKFAQMQSRNLKAERPLPLGDKRWTALELYLRSR